MSADPSLERFLQENGCLGLLNGLVEFDILTLDTCKDISSPLSSFPCAFTLDGIEIFTSPLPPDIQCSGIRTMR